MLSSGQNIRDGFAPDLKKYGSIITMQAQQLIDLVDQILLFAAMKDGKQKYQLEPVNVADLFKSLRKTTIPILEQAGFKIEIQVSEGLPPVLGDRQGLLRCVQNLIENAAKYSGDSRWIGIRAELEPLDVHSNRAVAMSVADHGVGIGAAELPHIFEPFYRGPRAISAQIHGSGLGLAVVRQIVNAIGASLSVKSELGKGSIFTLHLRAVESLPEISNIKMQEVVTSA
jgi:signal transduction histidine kinase